MAFVHWVAVAAAAGCFIVAGGMGPAYLHHEWRVRKARRKLAKLDNVVELPRDRKRVGL